MEAYEQFIESRIRRRLIAEGRCLDRMERKENKAQAMVGQIIRDGKIVHYVFPAGGKYREGSLVDLVQYLIRRGYV